MPVKTIDSFQGGYRFLSNFYPCEITHDGIEYPSTEHAFQAAKTLDFRKRFLISKLRTPAEAKRRGRLVDLRPDWDACRVQVMWELCSQKFARHPGLRRELLATGSALLVEGNTWGDTFWGVCRGQGENHLGKILMHVRSQLTETTWAWLSQALNEGNGTYKP